MNLASLDLNLLLALDALLQERSVTRAAARMGLSQPALSASLARLRRHFDDDLLTRVGNDYRLTPLAVLLKERTQVAVSGVDRVFSAQPDFDPAASTREFSLLASDYLVAILGDAVAEVLATEAPRGRLRFMMHTPERIDRAPQVLQSTDLLVMPHGFVADLPHRDLFRDEWQCVLAEGAAAGPELTIDDLKSMPWVVTYHGPTSSTPVSRQMRMLGIEPHIEIVTESFVTVPKLVAGSGRIAMLPRRLVDLLPADSGLRVLPPPFAATPLVEAMWWHSMYDTDPGHRYLREVMVRAARRITEATTEVDINGMDELPRQE